jgi:uncharacterized membrane protein
MYRNGFEFGGNGMMGGGWFGAALMGFVSVLFVVAVVMLIVMLVRRAGGHGPMMMHGMQHGAMGPMTPPVSAHDEAVQIARRRFAAGEITKEQFDEMMKALS